MTFGASHHRCISETECKVTILANQFADPLNIARLPMQVVHSVMQVRDECILHG